MGHLIHIVFVSRVGSSGSAYRVLLLPVEAKRKIANEYGLEWIIRSAFMKQRAAMQDMGNYNARGVIRLVTI